MNVKIFTGLISLIVITSMLIFSGCVEEKLATKEPFELALQLSDFPPGYVIEERGERLESDVDKRAFEFGWKEGYYSIFQKGNEASTEFTIVTQSISVYPVENISEIFTSSKKIYMEESIANGIVEELSKPNIGDNSFAYRETVEDEFEGTFRLYTIVFVKKDYYEEFRMGGITTDYELLRDVAMKAESKIE